jgi:antitoxin StbD
VLEQGGSEPVAVLNHNRPAAYLLSARVYQAMLERLNAELRTEIHQGIESGDALPAEDVFAELNARFAAPGQPSSKAGS